MRQLAGKWEPPSTGSSIRGHDGCDTFQHKLQLKRLMGDKHKNKEVFASRISKYFGG